MIPWSSYPAIRLLLPAVAGILLSRYTDPGWLPVHVPAAFFLLTVACIILTPIQSNFRIRWIPGTLISITLMLFFCSWGHSHDPRSEEGHLGHIDLTGENVWKVRIIDPPEDKGRFIKCRCSVKGYYGPDSMFRNASGKLLLMISKEKISFHPEYGDVLLIASKVSEVSPPGNPHAFDYSRYLSLHGIYHQSFVTPSEFKKIGWNGNRIKSLSIGAGQSLKTVLDRRIHQDDTKSIAYAILLGSKDELDRETMASFSQAGAMHILCVSGLHVGVIYVILNMVLSKSLGRLSFRLLTPLAILSGIWTYALITGLSPSVLRASAMFSIMTVGKYARRNWNVFNSLAGSALVLLLINPSMLLMTGFQLSYLAVAGIVVFHPPVYGLVKIKYPFMDKIWQLVCVSIAAQLGTFPLALYYFRIFPVYFILTNMVVIPLSAVIIYAGIAVFLLDPLGKIASLPAFILDGSLKATEMAVRCIKAIPGSVTHPVWLAPIQVVIIYVMVVSLFLFLVKKNKTALFACLGGGVILSAGFLVQNIRNLSNEMITIYKTPGHLVIDFYDRKKGIALYDSSFQDLDDKEPYFAEGNRLANGVREINRIELNDSCRYNTKGLSVHGRLINFRGKKIAIADEELLDSFPPGKPVGVDLLIIAGNAFSRADKINAAFVFDSLVLAFSGRYWYEEPLVEALRDQDLAAYSISREGALQLAW